MPRHRTWVVVGLAAWIALSATAARAGATRFTVVPERSRVEYVSGTQLGEFRGSTGQVTGEVVLEVASAPRAQVSVSIDPGKLRSDNAARDRHMWERLLEVGRFPAVTFRAREFRPSPGAGAAGGEGVLVGVLELHGVQRPAVVPVRYAVNGSVLQASGRFTLNLADFQMTPPRLLGLTVRDEVGIEVRLVAVSR